MAWETQTDRTVKRLRNIIVLLILLCIGLGGGMWYAFNQKQVSVDHSLQLKGELDQLMGDYTTIKNENEDLSAQLSDRDSIIMANAKEIQRLIANQADYNKIKKKLELLRKITQDYVHRIDSLVIENQTLTAENVQIKEEIATERRKNTSLNEEKQALSKKVEMAATLKAYNLKAQTVVLNRKGIEKPEDKAGKLTRISINFNLNENSLTPKGEKQVYACITRPDGVLISKDATSDLYKFQAADGQTVPFSIQETILYEGETMAVHMFWDKQDKKYPAMSGTYGVVLYIDGKVVGESSFTVRP